MKKKKSRLSTHAAGSHAKSTAGHEKGIKQLRLKAGQDAYQTLDVWSARLGIPVLNLLTHASKGAFPVFIHTNLAGNGLHYVNTVGLNLEENEVDYPPPLCQQRILKKPYYEGKLIGLCLKSEHCEKLAEGQELLSPFVTTVMFRGVGGIRFVDCKEDAWGHPLPDGIHLAIFPTEPPHDSSNSWGRRQPLSRFPLTAVSSLTPQEYLRAPISHRIKPSAACARDVDIAKFFDDLTSYRFIDELFDGEVIVKDLPAFISPKLRVLIEAHRRFWKGWKKLAAAEIALRRTQLTTHVQFEFESLCHKDSNPEALASFGARIFYPFTEVEDQQLPSNLITPHMLALLTAAKLYWQPHCDQSAWRGTCPPSKPVISFLQFLGMRELNAGRSGATLIDIGNYREVEEKNEANILKIEWPTTQGTLRPSL